MDLVVMYDLADDYGLLFSPQTAVSALYSQLKELQKKDADMKERDKMLVARDTDLPLAATLLKAYAKVEPLTIAELNYLLSLLHRGGVMLHAPNAIKLQHTVSAIAFVRCDNAHAVGTFRYRVETTIADGTAEGAFFCFDGVVTKLHSLRASEAGQMLAEGVNPEDFRMPPFTTHIEAKTYTFQFSTFTITLILDERDRVPVPDVVDNIGSDDDGDDMPDGNPIPVKVETGGSSGEAAFNADTDPVGVCRRRRPTHLRGG
ncbi:hypothetical protein Bca52824_059848 [Brassica carinata]|uniref:Uncharacterized protein n=1 Tax=Brassica carinata TaxID=52824 RepID=A0A8X7R0B5_BRACI|nr:hypothetical protein Bca52824_059848 [Brassica carinata]